ARTPPNSLPRSSGQPMLPAAPAAKAPAAPAVTTAAERIVTVNENGKSIRCRFVQTWRLNDGSTAHKLQAVESGEFITIVDDPAGSAAGSKDRRGRAARRRRARRVERRGGDRPACPAGARPGPASRASS